MILWYPKEVYHPDERITEQNKRDYERKQELIEKKCLELYPDFESLGFKERYRIRDEIRKTIS